MTSVQPQPPTNYCQSSRTSRPGAWLHQWCVFLIYRIPCWHTWVVFVFAHIPRFCIAFAYPKLKATISLLFHLFSLKPLSISSPATHTLSLFSFFSRTEVEMQDQNIETYNLPTLSLQRNLPRSKVCDMRLRSIYIIQHRARLYPRIVRDQEDNCISRKRFEDDGTSVEFGLESLVSFVITSVRAISWLAGRKTQKHKKIKRS